MANKCKLCDFKLKDHDSVVKCPSCGSHYHEACYNRLQKCLSCSTLTPKGEVVAQANNEKRQVEEKKRLDAEVAKQRAEQEKFRARMAHLKSLGKDGYYEYKVINILDKKGMVDTQRLTNELNNLGLDGWQLKCAYTNELGKDSLVIAGFGINSTADQNVLIFERFVKID